MDKDTIAIERKFFDDEALGLSDQELQIPTQADIQRYKNARISSANMSKDLLFAKLRPLNGKRVLDYGCGHGENSCILAACGADVNAFDLSPQSVQQARKRAHLHGLHNITFDVCAAGELQYPDSTFDVVTGFAILHHLHTILPSVFGEMHRLLKPGGVAAFIEPVVNSKVLRMLRRAAPISTDATPNERQLQYNDFEPMNGLFKNIEMFHFHGVTRAYRITGQLGMMGLVRIDHWLQRIMPPLKKYYGTVVVIATSPTKGYEA